MQTLLYKYLAQVGSVSVDGLGTFSILHNAPTYQTVAASYTAPQLQMVCNMDACTTSDGFIDYVATQRNTTYTSAKEFILEQVKIVEELISKNEFDEWKGIGLFKKNSEHKIILVPDTMQSYGQSIIAERVIRKDEVHAITVGETERTNIEMEAYYNNPHQEHNHKWWIGALVIGIASITYLVYYYIQHKNF
jgi:nucleoid DNA-binding protein